MVKNSPTLGTSNNYVASTLRKDFQVLFVIYIPSTPVGCTNANSIKLIKSKGDSTFPKKPSHPRGLPRGASPPKKWSHFSTKPRRKCTKYASTQILGELTPDASDQKVKKRESGIAYASGRIRPFPSPFRLQATHANKTLPSKVHLRKSGGGTVQLPE
jgi:hypothetical protein